MKIKFFKNSDIRQKLLDLDEIFSASDSCRKCGKCQSVCPVFRQTGFEQHTARGKLSLLNALKKDFTFDPSVIENHLRFCLLCGRCSDSCPAGIDTLSVFIKARNAMHALDKKSFIKKFFISVFIKFPFLFKFLRKNTDTAENTDLKADAKKVVFFTGCLFDRFFDDTAKKAVNFFKRSGFEPVAVSDECCGLPFLSSGDEKGFLKAAEKLYSKFLNSGADTVVSGCPTCISALKKIWPEFCDFGRELNDNFEILDFHQFAAKIIRGGDQVAGPGSGRNLKWHLPCHIKSLGAEKDAEYVLEKFLNFKPSKESKLNSCCGFGGTFSIDHPGISKKILDTRSDDLMLEEGEILVTGCPACILQLKRAAGKTDRIFHTIDIIDENKI